MALFNSYRNLPDNLNYMADSCHQIDQFICSSCIICCTAAISWSLDSWWDAPDNLVCIKSNVFIFNPSMMFLDGDIVTVWLIVYIVHCLSCFHMQCFGNWIYFRYQMQGGKVSLQSQLNLSFLTPHHFQNVILEKCQYDKHCPK